jgi:hypothetical protein
VLIKIPRTDGADFKITSPRDLLFSSLKAQLRHSIKLILLLRDFVCAVIRTAEVAKQVSSDAKHSDLQCAAHRRSYCHPYRGRQKCWRCYLIWRIVMRCSPENYTDVTCQFAQNRPLKLHVLFNIRDPAAIIARFDTNFFIYPISSACALYQIVKYNSDLLYS